MTQSNTIPQAEIDFETANETLHPHASALATALKKIVPKGLPKNDWAKDVDFPNDALIEDKAHLEEMIYTLQERGHIFVFDDEPDIYHKKGLCEYVEKFFDNQPMTSEEVYAQLIEAQPFNKKLLLPVLLTLTEQKKLEFDESAGTWKKPGGDTSQANHLGQKIREILRKKAYLPK